MHTPPGLRTARVIAGDVRQGDLLRHDGEWHPVVGISAHGRMLELKLATTAQPVSLYVAEPVLVCWPIPRTTVGMAWEVRR